MLFSAKESVYKTWFPMMKRWLGFMDVTVAFDPGRGSFQATLLAAPLMLNGRNIRCLEGRFFMQSGLILTIIALRHDHEASLREEQ